MDVNMTATAELFKAAARELPDLERFVFASSVAVHGPRAVHATDKVGPNALFCPPNLYGFWKIAGEGMAQAFHMETQIPTVSLRLATTYGPGRDRGMTSAPTTAMKAAVLGLDFEIPYSGREHYHFVDDVGAGFSEAAIAPFEGYGAYHIPGKTVPIADFCKLIGEMTNNLPDIEYAGKIRIQKDAPVVPFSCDLDHEPTLAAFPNMPLTPIHEGVRRSLDTFLTEKQSGELTTADIQ
jgi:nucleoside-diphosphate-sugar epimerase